MPEIQLIVVDLDFVGFSMLVTWDHSKVSSLTPPSCIAAPTPRRATAGTSRREHTDLSIEVIDSIGIVFDRESSLR